jgi:predicted CxxxxCH...CXXCH cytochrome family protein
MRLARISSLAVITAALLAGCDSARPIAAPGGDGAGTDCTACHGGLDNTSGAPPYDRDRQTDSPAIGAHTAHLAANVTCDACHVVPTSVSQQGHLGPAPAELVFGGAAILKESTPSYDAATKTCSNTYCHAGLPETAGGQHRTPVWTEAYATCTQCHGFPPPAPHPQNPDCSLCHLSTVNEDETLRLGGDHLNGNVEAGATHPAGFDSPALHGSAANYNDPSWPTGIAACRTCHGDTLDGTAASANISCNGCHTQNDHADWQTDCTFCHGDAARTERASEPALRAAPPTGSNGETDPADRAVGAHAAHLDLDAASKLSDGVACTECHELPGNIDHVNGTAALVFGPLASQGTPASGDGATSCANYCHGATLLGGTATSPTWAPPSTLACDACHGLPPASGKPSASDPASTIHQFHASAFRCFRCHGEVATNTTPPTIQTTADGRAKHVNGTSDIRFFTSAGAAASVTWDPSAGSCGSTQTGCHSGQTRTWRP